MGKLITIAPKEPNADSVGKGYFPLPLQRVGPSTWHKVMSADYGVNPIDGTHLVKPTFAQVAELAGDALTDRFNHGKDGKHNASFNPAIESIHRYVLTGNSIWVISNDKAYFVDNPTNELAAQFGVNVQNTLDRLVADFKKELEGKRERKGITYAENIASISVANVSQGEQSRNPKDSNYLGKNIGLIAATNKKVAESLAVGSRAYSQEPYFGLNAEANKIVTRVPVLNADGFGYWLVVLGGRYADVVNWCSFGYSGSGEATTPKK